MLLRLGLNAAAAGVVAGLALIAAEGWRRAYKAGALPELDRRGRSAGSEDAHGEPALGGEPLADEPSAPRTGDEEPGADER